MDILAWCILSIFYIAVGMPIIGDTFLGNGNNSYLGCLKVGAAINGFLIGFVAVLSSVLWAYIRLSS